MNLAALRSYLPWIIAALLLVPACAIRREIAISSAAPGDSVATVGEPGKAVRIASYRTRDGLRHEFDGTVRRVGDDLQFRRNGGAMSAAETDRSFQLPAAEVASVTKLQANPVGVLIAIPIVVCGLGLAIFYAVAG